MKAVIVRYTYEGIEQEDILSFLPAKEGRKALAARAQAHAQQMRDGGAVDVSVAEGVPRELHAKED